MTKIKRLNILFVADYFPALENGGTERQMYNLISGLVDAGHHVKLMVFRQTNFTREQEILPVQVQHLNLPKIVALNAVKKAKEIRCLIKKDNVDIVHVFFNDAAIFIPLALAGLSVAVVTSRRDMGIWYSPLNLIGLIFANNFVNAVVCNSRAVADLTCRKELLPKRKPTVIYNGIALANEVAKKNPFPFPSDRAVIGLVANISPVKKMEDLIGAALVLEQAGHTFNYVIVGGIVDSDYFSELEKLVQQSGLRENFIFLGSSPCPRNLMPYFSIGVLTSGSEGFSNTIMEYFAAELPVVCTDTGGNPELVVHEQTGLLYPPGDVSILADSIARLHKDSQLAHRLSQSAYAHIKTMTMDKMIQKHEELYCSLLK